jgi:hypothetical protein
MSHRVDLQTITEVSKDRQSFDLGGQTPLIHDARTLENSATPL